MKQTRTNIRKMLRVSREEQINKIRKDFKDIKNIPHIRSYQKNHE